MLIQAWAWDELVPNSEKTANVRTIQSTKILLPKS